MENVTYEIFIKLSKKWIQKITLHTQNIKNLHASQNLIFIIYNLPYFNRITNLTVFGKFSLKFLNILTELP